MFYLMGVTDRFYKQILVCPLSVAHSTFPDAWPFVARLARGIMVNGATLNV